MAETLKAGRKIVGRKKIGKTRNAGKKGKSSASK
jgi:hypothetical protein